MKNHWNKTIIAFSILIFLLASCSNNLNNTHSDSPWIGNWYGYVGDYFYRLTFTDDIAGLYYTSNTGYKLLYKSEKYEYTSKSFNVTFTKSSDGSLLNKDMEVYGTMISGRDDGFYLWNDTNRPFFKLD